MCAHLRRGLVVVLVMMLPPARLQADLILVGHRSSAAGREREILRNERLYEEMVAEREHSPTRFDRAHPFYARLLTDPGFFTAILERWQSHPACFEHHHPLAWRILDGKVHDDARHGQGGSIVPQPPPPGPPPPPPGPPPPAPPAVPEPSTMALTLSVVTVLLLARAGRRIRRR